ncbi:NACHT domain-containing protein, partial [bacterium]|nr:NACHT domain-containing protein [bacterium]
MRKFSKLNNLDQLSINLPSPLALPVANLMAQLKQGDWMKVFLAGMDTFFAGLKWSAFVGISDIFYKLESEHVFASRKNLDQIYPYIHTVLTPGNSHGQWVACVRAINSTFSKHPDWFFAPEFMNLQRKTTEDPMKFEDKLGKLIELRNQYAHRGAALPSGKRAKELWDELDPLIGAMYQQLSVYQDYHLIQFLTFPEPDEQKPGWFHGANYLNLKGYNLHENALLKDDKNIFYFGTKIPALRRLYLFKPNYSAHLPMYPFLLFDLGGELSFDNSTNRGPSTFLFNELQEKTMVFDLPTDGSGIEFNPNNEDTQHISGPLFQYFNSLKHITGTSDTEILDAMPGFPKRSKIINFERIIAFHTESFAGRVDYFQKVDSLIAGPFKAVWIKGLAGYGKTAFMAKLSMMHSDAIHYFITPDKSTANARTFLLHMSQQIVNKLQLPDIIRDEDFNSLEDLKKYFFLLLGKADEYYSDKRGKLLIFIDGLDESLRYASAKDEIISDYLPKSNDDIPDNVFFAISSRPEEVDLSEMVDQSFDLKPFTVNEVSTILSHYKWDNAASTLAYEKSAGQPLYFRFLLDEIKTKSLTTDKAKFLPDGIEGYYKKLWSQIKQDQESKKDKNKTRLAVAMKHILGFLACSQNPLSAMDLKELIAYMDSKIEQNDILQVLKKEYLGSYIIGSREFSVFHDTLREFILRQTRPKDDLLPYGDGIKYHEILAKWCQGDEDSKYGDKFHLYHLLHARQYLQLIEILEDSSENALIKRRIRDKDGISKLLNDLSYGISAAREMNQLDKVLNFTIMKLAMRQQRKAGAIPEIAGLLISMEKTVELNNLFTECETVDEKWAVASKAYGYFLKIEKKEGLLEWSNKLKHLIFDHEGEVYSKSEYLSTLFFYMEEPS